MRLLASLIESVHIVCVWSLGFDPKSEFGQRTGRFNLTYRTPCTSQRDRVIIHNSTQQKLFRIRFKGVSLKIITRMINIIQQYPIFNIE